MKNKIKILPAILGFICLSFLMANCRNDDYFHDGGVHNPYYDGTVLEYLEKFPDKNYFSDLVELIRYSELDKTLNEDEITFFAATDWSIRSSIEVLNKRLYNELNEDTIRDLRQIKPEVWKQYLSMYIVPGRYRLKDIPQLDTANVSAYPGAAYYSLGGKPMNIGVEYYDASGVKYAGARQILFSYVNNFSSMDMINAYVATCDIQPVNGVLHVIRFTDHMFGFDGKNFAQSALDAGILPFESLDEKEKENLTIRKKEDE